MEKKKTTKKNKDKIVEKVVKDEIKKAIDEAVTVTIQSEPEEEPEIVEDKTDSIQVLYFGYRGKGLLHGGRANEKDYQFTGEVPVTITNPIDITFFRTKAERNPEKWKVI